MNTKEGFKLIGHNHQIADTGDYDGCYEITNGTVSIFTKDDNDEGLQEIVDTLNKSDSTFYLDDSKEWEIQGLKYQLDAATLLSSSLQERVVALEAENARLNNLINNPELENFIEAVKIEAAHQLERWGIENEELKPPHHYILVATKLLGKLSIAIWDRDTDKFQHHCITLAAEMHNVHRQIKKEGTVIHHYFNQSGK